jgi:hypothetical protein
MPVRCSMSPCERFFDSRIVRRRSPIISILPPCAYLASLRLQGSQVNPALLFPRRGAKK